MKLTNLQAVLFFNNATGLKDKRLPIKVLFAIKNNINAVGDQLKAYEECRQTLVDTVTDPVDQAKAMSELLNDGTDYSNIKMLTPEDIEKIDTSDAYDTLTLAEVEALEFMIN